MYEAWEQYLIRCCLFKKQSKKLTAILYNITSHKTLEWQDHNDSCPTLGSISLFGLRTCPQYSIIKALMFISMLHQSDDQRNCPDQMKYREICYFNNSSTKMGKNMSGCNAYTYVCTGDQSWVLVWRKYSVLTKQQQISSFQKRHKILHLQGVIIRCNYKV